MEKVYLYIADVENFDAEALIDKLSAKRRERIARCIDETKRRQMAASEILCAYALRELGEKIELPLALAETKEGKPYIEGSVWEFNISHSGNIVCCALANIAVGADVQKMEVRDYEKLSERFCSVQERTTLLRFKGEKLRDFFYEYWVRKEAMTKRDGVGLRADFRKVDVTRWHVCCFKREDYMYAVATNKGFDLIVRDVTEKMAII